MTKRLVYLVILVLALGVTGFSQGSPSAPPGEVAIVPGRSIGPVNIGMPIESARRLMEQYGPVSDDSDEDTKLYCNEESGVGLCVRDSIWHDEEVIKTPGKVAFIGTDDERFGSPPLQVGQPPAADLLVPLLGKPDSASPVGPGVFMVRWRGRGVSVYFDSATIRVITVYAPRQ